jgi:hypothetical protein
MRDGSGFAGGLRARGRFGFVTRRATRRGFIGGSCSFGSGTSHDTGYGRCTTIV